jgi:hypothetical protein
MILIGWVMILVMIFGIAGSITLPSLRRKRSRDMARHLSHIENQDSSQEPEITPPPGVKAVPKKVEVGIYLDRIVEASIKDSSWSADFYIWFRWTDPNLQPGETFQIVDGKIESREKLKENTVSGSHYALYRVTAQITKFFGLLRFPMDDHVLTIAIEDTRLQSYQLRYTVDEAETQISSRVRMQGYAISDFGANVKPHAYKTRRGESDLPSTYQATYSQYNLEIWVKRTGIGMLMRMHFALFAAVAIAMLGLFIRPTEVDPRFGLPVGAFFAAVANTYVSASMLPDTGTLALSDVVNGLGLLAIFLILFESVVSLHIFTSWEDEELSGRLDRLTAMVLVLLYTLLNIAMVVSAAV